MYRVVLFGLPTAGKSTLSYLAANELSLPQINVGQLLRDSFLRCNLEHQLSHGQHLDNQLVTSVVYGELERVGREGFFLEGFPRNLNQLSFFETLSFSKDCCFIFLNIDPDSIHARYLRRMNCLRCRRADYAQDNIKHRCCSRCGGELVQRSDATPEALERKLSDYRLYEQPVVQRLKDEHKLLEISVVGDPDLDLPLLLKFLSKVE